MTNEAGQKEVHMTPEKSKFDWKRVFFILLGLALFFWIYFMPQWKDAVDPTGKAFPLSPEGKGAIALFLMGRHLVGI